MRSEKTSRIVRSIFIIIALLIFLVITSIMIIEYILGWKNVKDYVSPYEAEQIYYDYKTDFNDIQQYICLSLSVGDKSDFNSVTFLEDFENSDQSMEIVVQELSDAGIGMPIIYLNENRDEVSRIEFFMGSTNDGTMATYLIWYSDSEAQKAPPNDTLIENNWYTHQFLGV